MKLFIASILIVASAVGTANASSSVDVSDTPASDDMYSILVNAEGAEGTPGHSGKMNGQASLKPAFVGSLKSSAGVAPFSADATSNAIVQTTFLTSTSDRHVDGIWRDDGCRTPVPQGERVGFYALNTNEDAHFDADDKCVPIVEGELVHFDGRLPHHTVVNSGYVSLLGPFHFKTMKNVGGAPAPAPACCVDGTCYDEDSSTADNLECTIANGCDMYDCMDNQLLTNSCAELVCPSPSPCTEWDVPECVTDDVPTDGCLLKKTQSKGKQDCILVCQNSTDIDGLLNSGGGGLKGNKPIFENVTDPCNDGCLNEDEFCNAH